MYEYNLADFVCVCVCGKKEKKSIKKYEKSRFKNKDVAGRKKKPRYFWFFP